MKIVDVGGKKAIRLFSVVYNQNSRFCVKHGVVVIAKGERGTWCEIGKRTKLKEKMQIIELAQLYGRKGVVCIRSIIRFEFNYKTKRALVRLKNKIIYRGKADGIAGPGEKEKFPDLEYYALVKMVGK